MSTPAQPAGGPRPTPPDHPFAHVLVAVDLSPAGLRLLHHLDALRSLGAGHLTLVYVTGPALVEQSRKELEGYAGMARSQGFRVEVATPLGLPAEGILETASELGATSILLGTRSHSAVRHAFLGNVALEVMEKSPLPVLLQPLPVHDEAAPARGREIRSLLLATDFSDAAAPAAALAERLALEHGFPLDLVHALEGGTTEERKEEASLRLEGLARHFRDAGVAEVESYMPVGHPLERIPAVADRFPGALVVMGTRGRGFLGGLLLGSVSRGLAAASRIPLLLVPVRQGRDGGSDQG